MNQAQCREGPWKIELITITFSINELNAGLRNLKFRFNT